MIETEQLEPLLKLSEVAKLLGVSERFIQAEVSAGRLTRVSLAAPGAKKGPVRFQPSDVEAYVKSRVVKLVDRSPRA